MSSPALVVSNQPEEIPEAINEQVINLPLTLYKTTLPSLTQKVRMFIWHINDRPEFVRVSVRISSSTFNTVENFRQAHRYGDRSTLLLDGICLAQNQLYDDLESVAGTYPVSSGYETTLFDANLGPAGSTTCLFGAVLEFEIRYLFNDLRVRTCAESWTGARSSWSLDPLPESIIPNLHVRGMWPYSSVLMNLPVYDKGEEDEFDVNPANSAKVQFGLMEGDGEEHTIAFKKLSGPGHEFDTDNRGCYGANMHYQFDAENGNTELSGNLYIGLASRDTGGVFVGAGHISTPFSEAHKGIKNIPKSPGDTVYDVLDLLQFRSPNYYELTPRDIINTILSIASGGGAALPVQAIYSNYPILATPVDPPGGI